MPSLRSALLHIDSKEGEKAGFSNFEVSNAIMPTAPRISTPPSQAIGLLPPDPIQNGKHENTDSETPRPPKAYYIARELYQKLPLRMVGDLLYAFNGRVYQFVNEATMNRLIMGHCRQYVEAVGDASIIDRIYKVIRAEPEISFILPPNPVPFVALEDGLLNLETFEFSPHSPKPFVTVLLVLY